MSVSAPSRGNVDVTAARSAGLEIADLLHRFGDRTAVDGLTADVRRGEVVGLVGRNGAGKTTTMRAVMGILAPTGGAVRWAGHAVTHVDRMTFGYMPEERGLYPQMGVLDQLVYFARLHGLEAVDARRAAQEWLGRLDLRGRELDRVVALSHGNQQRVQLAVALVHGPELLVLDEPFSGLDPTVVAELSRTLRAEAVRGVAVLFSSHQLELVEQLCDRVVILEEGRMIASGTLAELRASLPQQLRVKVDSGTGWTERLTGVSVMRVDEDGVLLRLERRADPQVILKAAMAAGAVEHFGFEAGTLADVYRELMSP